MPLFKDQSARTIERMQTPKKIISLVPSQTELLYDLGLDEKVIGITKFCVHPKKWFNTKTRVGGTKQLNLTKIKELQPDLIIANKEENVKEQIEELAKEFPVWVSDITNLNDAVNMIESIGAITNKQSKASQISRQIKNNFSQLPAINRKPKTCYLIWRKSYMTVGGDTFINDMMKYGGFQNIFENRARYPETTVNELKAADCQLLLLSSEPYPFKQKHIDELQPQLMGTKILLVDGEFFSWYGSRLVKAPAYFQQLQNQVLSLSNAAGNR